MPATSLEIDQSFVRAMTEQARGLGFRVVVEGVASAGIYAVVHGMACDEAPGFHIARPMPCRRAVGLAWRSTEPVERRA